MKSPLRKRLLRELRSEAGKYLVIFLLLIGSIGFVSGFLVADGSMIAAYNESFERYNIEDGNFRLAKQANAAQRKAIQSLGVTLYDNFYVDQPLDNGSTLRIFQAREEVNRVCLMEGALPERTGEIAIDRMYADNNSLHVGDALTGGGHTWTITGLVALADYSALFSDNNDSMFDSVKFGVAIVTAEEFAGFDSGGLNYCYAWKYEAPPATEAEERDMAEDLMKAVAGEVKLESFLPRYLNQAIQFTGEDMGSDRAMMTALLYIIIVILGFVFGVTAGNTITREACVIGTLRASGYTRGELVRHYMAMPLLVTAAGALLGNLLGYTVFKNICAGMYYGSYSLPTYVTRWNGEAFCMTTLVPVALMAAINFFILRRKLTLSPLNFLRRDLSRRRRKRALRLSPRIPFFSRFRLRIIFQNTGSYAVLFVGILFANLLLLFGLIFPSILAHYQDTIGDNMLAEYQYMLQVPIDATDEDRKLESLISMLYFRHEVETDNPDAEAFSAYSLKTVDTPREEEIPLYGVRPDSRYVPIGAEGVYVSSAYQDKYGVSPGDTITLKEAYEDTQYQFTVTGVYPYDSALCVFMTQEDLNRTFDLDKDYFCGYFSSSEITDIDSQYIGSVIDLESMTKISRQLSVSMGSMMTLVDGFAVVMFTILIYLLSKLIIEKNAQSISMAKILGYKDGEISRLYILSTSILVVLFLLASLPIETWVMKWLFQVIMTASLSGWIPFYLDPVIYVKMFSLGIVTYALVALLEYRRIRRVPMGEALKNVE